MSTVALARLIQEALSREMEGVTLGLTGGGLKDFEEYKYLCGKRQGLQSAMSVVDDAMRRFDEQE